MCGIAGILVARDTVSERFPGAAESLCAALAHRGPDGQGQWISAGGRILLAHTRLAIQDPSPAGAQPMMAGAHALVLNGEIYNHAALRGAAQLPSSGDAATLLRLLAVEGERALPRLEGMFALALAQPDGSLLLARDAFGQKPLYFTHRDGAFAFASETRALLRCGAASARPDDVGLGALAQKGSLPGERTHLADVRMLPPGSWLRVRPDATLDGPHAFWRAPWKDAVGDFDHAVELLAPLLLMAARRVLVSDVPVAAFLSGGMDSTAACALLAAAGAKRLQTFCVALPGSQLDESAFAQQAAQALGLPCTTIAVDSARGRELCARAEEVRDTPGIDGANTYIIADAVKRAGFKVAVSGIGGDELFGGYPSFRDGMKYAAVARRIGRVSSGALKPLGALGGRLKRLGRAMADGLDSAALYCARRSLAAGYFENHRFAWAPLALEHERAYRYAADVRQRCQRLGDDGNQALEFEQRVYLHDQLLRDADQFGMACGLEIRAPLLDTQLAAACAQIVSSVKAARGPKGLLLAAVERATGFRFPRTLAARRKQGFALPNWSGR